MLHFPDIEKPINLTEDLYRSDVCGRCQVKIIDFGFLTQLNKTERPSFQKVTYVKSLRGTGFYISPEIIRQLFNPVTHIADDPDPPLKYT